MTITNIFTKTLSEDEQARGKTLDLIEAYNVFSEEEEGARGEVK